MKELIRILIFVGLGMATVGAWINFIGLKAPGFPIGITLFTLGMILWYKGQGVSKD